jgi:copper chaperone CopZ
MNSTILQVHGMHCASCASIITRKISKLPGVEYIDVNPGTEKATLNFDPQKTNINQMNSLGYHFSETDITHTAQPEKSEYIPDTTDKELEAE